MGYASVKIANDELLAAVSPYAGTSAKPIITPEGSVLVVLEKQNSG
jgi:hypothetical protein